jgi:hypothetical protein
MHSQAIPWLFIAALLSAMLFWNFASLYRIVLNLVFTEGAARLGRNRQGADYETHQLRTYR